MEFTITEPAGLESKHRAMLMKITAALSESGSRYLLPSVYAALVMRGRWRGADTPAEMFVSDLLSSWEDGGLPLTSEYTRQALKEFEANFDDAAHAAAVFAERYPEAVAAAQAGREEAE